MAKAMGRASEASTIGFTIAICFVVGFWLDRWLETSPILSVVGLGLGLATAFAQLMAMIRRLMGKDSMQRTLDPNQESYRAPSTKSPKEKLEKPF